MREENGDLISSANRSSRRASDFWTLNTDNWAIAPVAGTSIGNTPLKYEIPVSEYRYPLSRSGNPVDGGVRGADHEILMA